MTGRGYWATRVGELSTSQLVLRCLVLLGPVVATLTTGPAGRWAPWWVLVPVVALAIWFAVIPGSAAGVAVFLAVLVWWAFALGDGLGPMVLVAVAALLAAHLAAVLTSYGPGEMPVHPRLLRRWALRGILAFLVALPVWGLARLLRDGADQGGVWVTGVAVALVATVAAAIAFGGGPGHEDAP